MKKNIEFFLSKSYYALNNKIFDLFFKPEHYEKFKICIIYSFFLAFAYLALSFGNNTYIVLHSITVNLCKFFTNQTLSNLT